MSFVAQLLRLFIAAYRLVLSPLLGNNCRYLPSCSAYGYEAVGQHGAAKGSWLTLKRLCRCHPWGGAGFDPVPQSVPRAGSWKCEKVDG